MLMDIERIRVAGRPNFYRFTQACRGDLNSSGRTEWTSSRYVRVEELAEPESAHVGGTS